jgi:hypothetical protein
MTINGNEILEKLAAAKKEDRAKISLYLSKSLYKEFKDRCGDIPASVVLEQLIREFLSTSTQKKKKK